MQAALPPRDLRGPFITHLPLLGTHRRDALTPRQAPKPYAYRRPRGRNDFSVAALPVIANNQECEGEAKTLTVSAEERNKVLLRTRDLKMASSVHAFVRGNTAQFYQWLADLRESIPSGPPIWICGDCHLGNLGPVADVDGNIDIQIRDLDQTVTGNPAFDLIRLGLSLETAARSSDLPGVTTARMLEAMIEGYTAGFESSAKGPSLESEAVKTVRRQAAGRRWRDLAKERLEDVEPNIPLGKRFWMLDQAESKAVTELFEEPFVRERFFALADLDASGSIRVVDALLIGERDATRWEVYAWLPSSASEGKRRARIFKL